MHDPQNLTPWGSIKALFALGRIPLASEVPLWGFFGCLLSSRIFPSTTAGVPDSLDWITTLQCMAVVWGTNISINYGNEYFDWDMDRPGMVASIQKDVEARERIKQDLKDKAGKANGNGKEVDEREVKEKMRKEFGNEKIMGSSSRILHDGTFPPYVALVCATFIQVMLLALIVFSRSNDPQLKLTRQTLSSGRFTPFRGIALQLGLLCTFLSQTYVGPPLRLHYHGFGEFISALLLSSVTVLFSLAGYYSGVTGRSISPSDVVASKYTSASGFYLDKQIWSLLAACYFYEQARILIMHIHDIEADRKGGKITLVVRIGYDAAKWLYLVLNAIGLAFFGYFISTLYAKEGLLSKVANGSTIVAGLGALGAFALPIIVITARSLFYHSPTNRGRTDHISSTIPILPHADLAKIVSLQTLLTPVFLAITLLIAT
jgi:1,4-dihydroxy-2-naphthoate octaprenyltransferase